MNPAGALDVTPASARAHGIGANGLQFAHQLLQVLLVGMTIGMMRNVVPALAETEFGVPRGDMLLLVTFVLAFGLVKGVMNLLAGRLADRHGRRRVLLAGWLFALPIPWMLACGPTWNWIVAATLLLGLQQGLAWSMTQTAALDLTRADQRGWVIGLNEFAGYLGVALAGIATGHLAAQFGPREGLLAFGVGVSAAGTLLAAFAVVETLPWAAPAARTTTLPIREVFLRTSWRDPRLAALCQAGLVEKFVDALVWIVWPVWLHRQGMDLPGIGWIVAAYGITWGIAQLLTGRLSDRLGRHRLNVGGMWLCGLGVALLPLGGGPPGWTGAAVVTGLGMAMLYPNLSAAVADLAQPAWRASAIGVYRCWRDLGYGLGALGLGLAVSLDGRLESAFWFVALAMAASALALQRWGEESHPRLRRPLPDDIHNPLTREGPPGDPT